MKNLIDNKRESHKDEDNKNSKTSYMNKHNKQNHYKKNEEQCK